MDYDVIIIGAGMSGLAAGIRLAQFDRRVCIVERHYNFGGLNSFYTLNGRRFDVGLHMFLAWPVFFSAARMRPICASMCVMMA